MRSTVAVLLAFLATAAGAAAGRAPANACRAPLPHGPAVPAPIVLWSDCGVYRIERDGQTVQLPRSWLARHGSGTGRRYGKDLRLRWTREGRFFLTRRGREVWRSTGTYRNEGSGVAYGQGLFVFTSFPRGVFLTDLEGPERLVLPGRALYVPGFTPSGKLFVTGGGVISVLSRSGDLLRRVLYRQRRGFGFDDASGTIFFVTRSDRLAALHETRVRLLRRAPGRFGYLTLSQPNVLVWYGTRSIVAMDRDGKMLAAAGWPRSQGSPDLGVSASLDSRFFAFRLSARRQRGGANVRLVLLRAGERRGEILVRHRFDDLGCGVWGAMRWNGRHLLYDYGRQGRVVVLAADSGEPTSLTRVVRGIPRRAPVETVGVAWADDFSR